MRDGSWQMRALASVLALVVLVPAGVAPGQTASSPSESEPLLDAVMLSGPIDPRGLVVVDGVLYFAAREPRSRIARLWRSDGTDVGTYPIEACRTVLACGAVRPIGHPIAAGGLVYFFTSDGLWRSDGTDAGTFMVAKDADVRDHDRSAVPRRIERVRSLGERHRIHDEICDVLPDGDLLYVVAERNCIDPYPEQLWVTDGTLAGTYRLHRDTAGGLSRASVGLPAGRVFAAWDRARTIDPWITDGTPKGTRRLKDLKSRGNGVHPESLRRVGDVAFFTADDGRRGAEPWVTDGTPGGTRLLKDIRPGKRGSAPQAIEFADVVLFTANDGSHGQELWVSDGTPEGTQLLMDIRPGRRGSLIEELVPVPAAGLVLFVAHDGVHGPQLWTTDGTTAGTRLLTDDPATPVEYFSYRTLGERVVLLVAEGDQSVSLSSTDGTAEGTEHFAAICEPGPNDGCRAWFTGPTDGGAYLTVRRDGSRERLWQTDGTAAGTSPAQGGLRLGMDLISHEGRSYVVYGDPEGDGGALWRSDGVLEDAEVVSGNTTGEVVATDGGLFFVASEDRSSERSCWSTRCRLWLVPGTADGGLDAEDQPAAERGETTVAAIIEGFPTSVVGRQLDVRALHGPSWLDSFDPEDPDDAAAIDAIEGFVTRLGRTIDDLRMSYAWTMAQGRPVTVTAVSIGEAARRPLIDAIIPFLFADTVEPARKGMRIAGKRVIEVRDAAIPGSYPRYIYPRGDVVWLIEADRPVLREIVTLLP